MSTQSEVMHCYEHIATLSERMLMLARTGLWGELPALEAQYSDKVDHLKAIEPLETLDEAQSARKYRLLSRITSTHDEVCSFVMRGDRGQRWSQSGALPRAIHPAGPDDVQAGLDHELFEVAI